MKKFDLALVAGLVISIFVASFTTFARDCDDVRQNVVRLHILANSDSVSDQELKLAIRDRILAESALFFEDSETKEQAELTAKAELSEIERISRNEITRKGYDYPVKAEIVNMFFDTRTYENVTLPAGRYDAVRISIGDANGKNWWCVLFPPMCVPAASEKLPVDEQIEALQDKPRYLPKFAILELVESLSKDNDVESLPLDGEILSEDKELTVLNDNS